jgi:hypothetical protein
MYDAAVSYSGFPSKFLLLLLSELGRLSVSPDSMAFSGLAKTRY